MYQRKYEYILKNIDSFLRSEDKNGKKSYSLAPCMRINRPHLRFLLSYKLTENKNVNIEIIKSTNESLYFATFGYNKIIMRLFRHLKSLRKGKNYHLKTLIIIAFFIASTKGGCLLDESIIGPEVLLKISLTYLS